jgi:hypothetical protein
MALSGGEMSVSEPSGFVTDVATLRWTGYGLAAAGTAATILRVIQPGPLWSGVLLIAAVLGLAVVVRAPEAFETRWRGGSRRLNPLVGAPACFLFFIALTDQVDDLTLPVAGAAVGAAVLLMISMRGLERPGLTSPLTYQIMMALLGAAVGYGAVVALDVDYDASPPAVLSVPVQDKYVTTSRSSTTYHLRVPPFGARRKASSITVSRATYAALSPGSQVCVLEHRGTIGLTWVTARLCDR